MTKREFEELKNYIEKGTLWDDPEYEALLKELNLYKKEVIEALYDGGIKETDEYIGLLIKELKKLDLFKNTIIILTSDHGEEFGDHGENNFYNSHNYSLYDELIHIPLIMILPGNFPNGSRINSQVRHIDIMPTLLKLANIKYPANKMQGTSLLPIIRGNEYNEELVAISEAIVNGPYESKSIRTNRYKYLYLVNFNESEEKSRLLISENPFVEELFSLENDPGEKINLCMEENNFCNKLKNKINKILSKAITGPRSKKDNQFIADNKMKKQLKTLGYIQ
jgi:arylsulfatase A-like enzyme